MSNTDVVKSLATKNGNPLDTGQTVRGQTKRKYTTQSRKLKREASLTLSKPIRLNPLIMLQI